MADKKNVVGEIERREGFMPLYVSPKYHKIVRDLALREGRKMYKQAEMLIQAGLEKENPQPQHS